MLNPEYPYYRDYIRGMKTGFTTLAGRCYVTFAQKDGQMCIRDRCCRG